MYDRAHRLLTATALLVNAPARADELHVMTSGAFTAAFVELASEFERVTGHTIVTVCGTLPHEVQRATVFAAGVVTSRQGSRCG